MRHISLLILFFITLSAVGQQFKYEGIFEGIGDNREYASRKAYSQTILGSRGTLLAGVDIDNHKIRAGVSHLLEFGDAIDGIKPHFTIYYSVEDSKKTFKFGAFPRKGLIDFPLAMITDTISCYRPNIEGLYGEVRWSWGRECGFVDWMSRQTNTVRENFMAGFSGEIFHKGFFLQNFLYLYHDAGAKISVPGEHLKDYLGFIIQGGIRTNEASLFQGYIKAGLLESSFRERKEEYSFVHSFSFLTEADARYKNYGIHSTLHSGDGHDFKTGDLFYRLKNYWRTDLIWYMINHKNVTGSFNLSFHIIDWKKLDQQQQFSLVYRFGN